MKYLGLAAFAAGFAVLIYLLMHFGLAPITASLSALGVGGLAIVVAAHLPVAVLLGLAWWSLAGNQPAAAPHKFIFARMVRDGAAEVLPFSQLGGYVLGARALSLFCISGFFAAISTVVDLSLELAAKLPYLIIGLGLLALLHPDSTYYAPILMGIAASSVVLVLAGIYRDRSRTVLESLAVKLSNRFPMLHMGNADETRATINSTMSSDGRNLKNFAFHFFAWLMGAAETWIAFYCMGVEISFAEALVIDSLFTGIRTFAFFIPGAVGVQEAAYVALGAMFGVPPGAALAFSLIRRARDFILGIPSLLVWQWIEGRRFLIRRQAR